MVEQRFQGESLNKVDGKGRVAIPVKFRRVLQNSDAQMPPGGSPRLYIAYGNPRDNFVECLSGDAFDHVDALIQAERRGTPARKVLEHLYYSKCEETTVDDAGRLVLPPLARAKIALEGEALFRGRGDKFHILNPSDGAAAEEDLEAMMAALGEGDDFFDPLALVGQYPARAD